MLSRRGGHVLEPPYLPHAHKMMFAEQVQSTHGLLFSIPMRVPVKLIKDFTKELAAIRARGWDFTRGEKIAESIAVAAPVFTARGVIGSLSLTIPAVRFDEAGETGSPAS